MKYLTDNEGNKYEIVKLHNPPYGADDYVLRSIAPVVENKAPLGWLIGSERKGSNDVITVKLENYSEAQLRAMCSAFLALLEYVTAENPNRLGETVYIRDAIEKARQAVQEGSASDD